LTSVEVFQIPEITPPDSGPTHLGAALEVLCQRVDGDVRRGSGEIKGDWKPLLFIMTDGSPSDLRKYRDNIPEVKKRGFGEIVACAAGMKAKEEHLRELANIVVCLDTMDGPTFMKFFKWVSASISMGNMSMGASSQVMLPPPPPEVRPVTT